jgi:hypothetical protein
MSISPSKQTSLDRPRELIDVDKQELKTILSRVFAAYSIPVDIRASIWDKTFKKCVVCKKQWENTKALRYIFSDCEDCSKSICEGSFALIIIRRLYQSQDYHQKGGIKNQGCCYIPLCPLRCQKKQNDFNFLVTKVTKNPSLIL